MLARAWCHAAKRRRSGERSYVSNPNLNVDKALHPLFTASEYRYKKPSTEGKFPAADSALTGHGESVRSISRESSIDERTAQKTVSYLAPLRGRRSREEGRETVDISGPQPRNPIAKGQRTLLALWPSANELHCPTKLIARLGTGKEP